MKKLKSFEDVVGHKNLLAFLKDHLNNNTLPQFLIFEGDEGLGKSSLAKILALELLNHDPVIESLVVDQNKSTESVLLYNMSINGGKDTAKEVEANLSLNLSSLDKKIIILDEAHAMSDAAQDVFLVSTEYLPDNVYLFLCTTDSLNIKPTLKSRAFTIHLNHLTHSEMVELLTAHVRSNELKLQAENATINLIADWADGKPRIALNLLNGFRKGSAVTASTIKEFINYLDVDEVLPLLSSLAGSMVQGLSYISEMTVNDSFIPLLIEIFKVHRGMASFKLSLSDTKKVRISLADVPTSNMLKFIYTVTSLPKLTKPGLISAFLSAHVDYEALNSKQQKAEILKQELQQKAETPNPAEEDSRRPAAPSLDELLLKGVVLD